MTHKDDDTITYTLQDLTDVQEQMWRERDACTTHYPQRCPTNCTNAGQHTA